MINSSKIFRILLFVLFLSFGSSVLAQEIENATDIHSINSKLQVKTEELLTLIEQIDDYSKNQSFSARPTVPLTSSCVWRTIHLPMLSQELPLKREIDDTQKVYNAIEEELSTIGDPLVNILRSETPLPLPRKLGQRFYKVKLSLSDLSEEGRKAVLNAMKESSVKF